MKDVPKLFLRRQEACVAVPLIGYKFVVSSDRRRRRHSEGARSRKSLLRESESEDKWLAFIRGERNVDGKRGDDFYRLSFASFPFLGERF